MSNVEKMVQDSERRSRDANGTLKHSFNDIVLNQNTYDAIQDVLAVYGKQHMLFDQWGLGLRFKDRLKGGINLYGPPGTGKTMAANAIANQLGRKLLVVDYSQIESKWVGQTSKNITSMFNEAKKNGSIIFFDEADALLSRRITNVGQAADVGHNQDRSVLLKLLDDTNDLVLFASNFITNYDPAFIRRIQTHIKFELPDEKNRLKLWRMYIPGSLPTDVNTDSLAAKYDGISGSDIATAVFNASLRAARLNDTRVHHRYFEEAIEAILKVKMENGNVGQLHRIS